MEAPIFFGNRTNGSRGVVRRCPPHTPLTVVRTPGGGCVAECLGCAKRGPERESSEAARVAFYESAGRPSGLRVVR